jgi:hypothetical protein
VGKKCVKHGYESLEVRNDITDHHFKAKQYFIASKKTYVLTDGFLKERKFFIGRY